MPTMTINFLDFASGQQLSFLPSVTIPFIPDAGLGSVAAPASVLSLNADSFFLYLRWEFGFWNINGSLSLTPTAALPEPVHDFTASAWYFEVIEPRIPDEITVVAFSLNKNSVLTGDGPIASVTPASAQAGPNGAFTTDGPVTIEAVDSISGEGNFVSWLPHSVAGGAATATGKALTAPQSSAVFAVAFYR